MKKTLYMIDDAGGTIAKDTNFKIVLNKWIKREINNILQTFIEDDEQKAKDVVLFLRNYRISKKVSPYLHFKAVSSVISEYEDVERAYGVRFKEISSEEEIRKEAIYE